MNFLGDLAFIIGTMGVIVYLCLIVIRYTSRAAKLKTGLKRYTEQLARLEQRVGELKEKQAEVNPQVDELVSRMIELREVRDKLQFRYEDMVARSQQREIHIKYNAR